MTPFSGRTIKNLVEEACSRHKNSLAVIDGNRRITYGELGVRSNRLANALQGLGLQPGKSVGILSNNRLEYIEIDFALAKAGLVRVPLYARNSPDEHAYFATDAGIGALFVESEYVPSFVQAMARHDAPIPTLIILDSDNTRASYSGAYSYEALLTGRSAARPPAQVNSSDTHQIRYTAGTTGKPKGAISNHGATATATMGNVYFHGQESGLPAGSKVLHLSPFSHGGGFFIVGHSWMGATHVILREWDPEQFSWAVESHRVTHTLLVPTMIKTLIDALPGIPSYDYSSLSTIGYAASPITTTLLREALDRFGPVLTQGYGLSESPSLITALPKRDHDLKNPSLLESCGLPAPWVEIKILDADGEELPYGEVGELYVAGPQIFSGYHGKPDSTAGSLQNGWVATGDMGTRDEAGYIYLKTRKSEMIISGGFNIYPAEVENVLSTHEVVEEVAVLGQPDDKWGEIVCAVIHTNRRVDASADQVVDFCKKSLGSYKAPKRVYFLDHPLPKTDAGKVSVPQIRDVISSLSPVYDREARE